MKIQNFIWILREFYFKCSTCEIITYKLRKNYVVKHIESDYPS